MGKKKKKSRKKSRSKPIVVKVTATSTARREFKGVYGRKMKNTDLIEDLRDRLEGTGFVATHIRKRKKK